MLESQIEGRGEVWLCTSNPSDFLCFVTPSRWDYWFSLVPVQLSQSPSPAAGGSSRGEPKRLRFRLGVNAGPGAGPGGAAQQIADTLGRLVAGVGICEQVPHSIGSAVSVCVCAPPFCCYFARREAFSLALQPWKRQCCPLGVFDGTGELETP